MAWEKRKRELAFLHVYSTDLRLGCQVGDEFDSKYYLRCDCGGISLRFFFSLLYLCSRFRLIFEPIIARLFELRVARYFSYKWPHFCTENDLMTLFCAKKGWIFGANDGLGFLSQEWLDFIAKNGLNFWGLQWLHFQSMAGFLQPRMAGLF